MKALRRRLGLIAVGAALALAILEILLQVVSFVIWASSGEDVVHDDGARVVLCVGDSFTEGMGASGAAQSYPRRLERVLSTREQRWRVYNCGLAGSTSRAMLEKLPRQLDTYRPNLLCVLIGYNDFWHEPEPLPVGEITKDTAGFRWEIRVWKLGRMILHSLRSDTPVSESVPFLGAWHGGATWLRFLENGRVETESGDLYWFVHGDRLELRLPTRGQGVEATWRMKDGKLVVTGGLWSGSIELSRGMPVRHDVDRGRNALDRGELDAAEKAYRRALVRPELELQARSGLVRVFTAAGKRVEALQEVEVLRLRFATQPTADLGDALARAYNEIGDVDRAVAVSGGMLVDQPITLARLSFLLEHALAAKDPAKLLPFIESALQRDGVPADIRGALFGGKAQLATDPIVSIICLLEAWRMDRQDWLIHKTVLAEPNKFTAANLEQALATMQITVADREAIRAVYEGSFRLENRTTEVLAGHLRRTAELAQQAGAEPVFLVYPIEKPDVEKAVKAVARELSVRWIDVRGHFTGLLETGRYEDFFVLDGHCNDRGYAEIARLLAAALR